MTVNSRTAASRRGERAEDGIHGGDAAGPWRGSWRGSRRRPYRNTPRDHVARDRRRALPGLALVCLPLAGAPLGAQPGGSPVGVDAVRVEALTQTMPVLGRLIAPQAGVVAARAAGPVARLDVQVGDSVARGDRLGALDQARLTTQLELQNAELDALRADRDSALARERYAGQELARIGKLRNSAAFSQYDYDARQQELNVTRAARLAAEARIAQGEVNKRLAEIELQDGQILAPFPGVVTRLHTSEGAWLKVGDPVVTLINDVDLEIEAEVPATRLGGVSPGVEVAAQLDDGYTLRAQVRAVIPDENPSAGTRPVRFTVRLDPGRPRPALAVNQPVTLQLPVSAAGEMLTVAKDAVIRRGSGAMVFVVADGQAQPRPVQLGEALEGRFQVLDGLQPGDLVVVRGNERLRPGQPVTVAEAAAPGPTAASDAGGNTEVEVKVRVKAEIEGEGKNDGEAGSAAPTSAAARAADGSQS